MASLEKEIWDTWDLNHELYHEELERIKQWPQLDERAFEKVLGMLDHSALLSFSSNPNLSLAQKVDLAKSDFEVMALYARDSSDEALLNVLLEKTHSADFIALNQNGSLELHRKLLARKERGVNFSLALVTPYEEIQTELVKLKQRSLEEILAESPRLTPKAACALSFSASDTVLQGLSQNPAALKAADRSFGGRWVFTYLSDSIRMRLGLSLEEIKSLGVDPEGLKILQNSWHDDVTTLLEAARSISKD